MNNTSWGDLFDRWIAASIVQKGMPTIVERIREETKAGIVKEIIGEKPGVMNGTDFRDGMNFAAEIAASWQPEGGE